MSPPRFRLVGSEEAEPPEQVRLPAPRLRCADCGERVMAARCGDFVVVLSSDHRCPPVPALTPSRKAVRDTLAWIVMGLLLVLTVALLDVACAGGDVR